MSELTPRNAVPYPSEREQPFFDAFKAGVLAEDAIQFSNSDNSNVVWTKGGTFTWDVASSLLSWTDTIFVNGYHNPFGGFIAVGSIQVAEDEVVYFQFPRLVQSSDTALTLLRSSRVFLEGARLADLKIFVTRRGNVIYFANGGSLVDGDVGKVFESGLIKLSATLPHKHEVAWLFIAPSAGLSTITPSPVIISPDLFRVDVYRNGALQAEGAGEDYTIDLLTGIITLATLTIIVPLPDKFIVFRETRDATGVTVTSHQHIVPLLLKPTPGTATLNALVTSPFLLRVDVFRNGQLLVEGGTEDFTVDLVTGNITLAVPSISNDKFVINRETALP